MYKLQVCFGYLYCFVVLFNLQFEKSLDMNISENRASSIRIQQLNSGLPIQESVDGWMLTAQSTQRGEICASAVHEPGSILEEDAQVEVLA